jgi:RNA polymerase sigma factor (sigma-70 family)
MTTIANRPRVRGRGIPPFQAFLDEHRDLVYRFLLATVGPNEADDCFQETFLSALRAYPNLHDGHNLRSWVLTIAANKATDAGRARGRRATPVNDVAHAAEAGSSGATVRKDERSEPLDPANPLWASVRSLPDRQRTAVVLRAVLDRPYPEVAAAMGSSEETARANVHQGLKRLRHVLEGHPDREVRR